MCSTEGLPANYQEKHHSLNHSIAGASHIQNNDTAAAGDEIFASSVCLLFPSYFSNFAVLVLVATSLIAQLTHICKIILMCLISGKKKGKTFRQKLNGEKLLVYQQFRINGTFLYHFIQGCTATWIYSWWNIISAMRTFSYWTRKFFFIDTSVVFFIFYCILTGNLHKTSRSLRIY